MKRRAGIRRLRPAAGGQLILKCCPLKPDPHRSGCGILEGYLRVACESQGRVDIGHLSHTISYGLAKPGLTLSRETPVWQVTGPPGPAIVVHRRPVLHDTHLGFPLVRTPGPAFARAP
jgi:hypothetical protein